ncbi:hypothetical protein OVA19_00140 [Streptomyces sp. SL203]|nr:hypothetical protein [Streptomyces sp. SL203]MCY1649231.1 hypothetical protein [Streptomyces sp. SL203]
MTTDRNADGGNAYHQIARELADAADARAHAGHHRLAKTTAELGLLYLELALHAPAGEHGVTAWEAAEEARDSLQHGTAVDAAATTARARLHLGLDTLDRPAVPAQD